MRACAFTSVWACACVCVRLCVCASAWMRAGPSACASCVRACLCVRLSTLCVCVHIRVRTCGRDINGTRRVLVGHSMAYSCSWGVLWGTYRVLPESAYVRVWLCIFWGCMAHHNGGARHCTGALGKLAPPEGYSTSTHVGVLSCGPSLRVRLRRDADADHRRAGRRSVGYELL